MEKSSLHRCAIALCSNQAVAEGVCSMHLSRSGPSGPSTVNAEPRYSQQQPLHDDGLSGDRYYRSSSHAAVQPRLGPLPKKQKQSSASESGEYGQLTSENLGHMKFARNGPTTAYDSDPYVAAGHAHQAQLAGSSNTGSNRSESDDGSLDADKETNLRRERNRIAARKSRQRKLDRISSLEDEKMRLEQHRDMLVQEIRSLERKDAGAGASANAVMTITDREYQQLQNKRMQIIKHVEDAYNTGDILATVKYFRDDSIVSGPQNSSVHLRGKDAIVLDYICTTYLFGDIHLHHTKIDCGGPRSQHFRVHWVLSGKVKSAGVSMNKEFLELIESVKGKRVTIEGVSNFSFSGDKIVYVHRTADQAKFLSALVNLNKH